MFNKISIIYHVNVVLYCCILYKFYLYNWFFLNVEILKLGNIVMFMSGVMVWLTEFISKVLLEICSCCFLLFELCHNPVDNKTIISSAWTKWHNSWRSRSWVILRAMNLLQSKDKQKDSPIPCIDYLILEWVMQITIL